MTKKNEKRICWNCDGVVSLHLEACPYCGVDISNPAPHEGEHHPHKEEEMGSPFQKAPRSEDDPFHFHPRLATPSDATVAVTDDEWKNSLENEEEEAVPMKGGVMALVLLLPGIGFLLFSLFLLFFSKEGVLVLHWKQSMAFFYFLGSLPLIYFGWRIAK